MYAQMEMDQIFRNTRCWYSNRAGYASPRLIDFARRNAGKRILDIGCATGDYLKALTAEGFNGVDVEMNPDYVEEAKGKGLDVYRMDAKSLQCPDKSFDTALLFEVLEHIDDPQAVLREAKRVAQKNVLITVPNCTGFHKLCDMGLTFEHMLEKDHINFFTKADLEMLLSREFADYDVREEEPMYPSVHKLPWRLRRTVTGLYRLMHLPPLAYFRLYAVASIRP
jgi:SAM-dependent methyltransferase